jgi:hypothetical protein
MHTPAAVPAVVQILHHSIGAVGVAMAQHLAPRPSSANDLPHIPIVAHPVLWPDNSRQALAWNPTIYHPTKK